MKTKSNFWMILMAATAVAIILTISNSCKKDEENDTISNGAFTDPRDGTIYKTLKIGNQTWMAENLKYLPSVVGSATGSTTMPNYYVYGYNDTVVSNAKATENYKTYGVLYNWESAKTACPAGWHLPSDVEWSQLMDRLGGESEAGSKLKESGTLHWNDPNTEATNETGFTALPGGYRNNLGEFYIIGTNGYWWSATSFSSNAAWGRGMYYKSNQVSRDASYKENGFSVRCVKD